MLSDRSQRSIRVFDAQLRRNIVQLRAEGERMHRGPVRSACLRAGMDKMHHHPAVTGHRTRNITEHHQIKLSGLCPPFGQSQNFAAAAPDLLQGLSPINPQSLRRRLVTPARHLWQVQPQASNGLFGLANFRGIHRLKILLHQFFRI